MADVTVQWCLIAEALNRSVHRKGPHGYGSLCAPRAGSRSTTTSGPTTAARNPRLGDDYGRPPWPLFDVRNNVIYDYGGIASGLTGDKLRANYVGELRPARALQRHEARGHRPHRHRGRELPRWRGTSSEGRPALTVDNRLLFDRVEAGGRRLVTLFERPVRRRRRSARPARSRPCGRSWPGSAPRGPVATPSTSRVVSEVGSRAGRIIDSQEDVGGVAAPTRPDPRPHDADADGMPDDWERAQGSTRTTPPTARAPAADGYTNLEVYLNELAGPPGRGRCRRFRRAGGRAGRAGARGPRDRAASRTRSPAGVTTTSPTGVAPAASSRARVAATSSGREGDVQQRAGPSTRSPAGAGVPA